MMIEEDNNLEYLYWAIPSVMFDFGSPYEKDVELVDEQYVVMGDLLGDYTYDDDKMEYVPTNKYYIRQYKISDDFQQLKHDDFLVNIDDVSLQLL